MNPAIDAFIKGLHAETKTREQEISLYYELGDALRVQGQRQEALYYFRKVAHRSPNHDDPRGTVAVRIRNVQALGIRPVDGARGRRIRRVRRGVRRRHWQRRQSLTSQFPRGIERRVRTAKSPRTPRRGGPEFVADKTPWRLGALAVSLLSPSALRSFGVTAFRSGDVRAFARESPPNA